MRIYCGGQIFRWTCEETTWAKAVFYTKDEDGLIGSLILNLELLRQLVLKPFQNKSQYIKSID